MSTKSAKRQVGILVLVPQLDQWTERKFIDLKH